MLAVGTSWTGRSRLTENIDLMSEALQMALTGRSCDCVFQHPDQGSQYSAKAYQSLCEAHGIQQSMGRVGDFIRVSDT